MATAEKQVKPIVNVCDLVYAIMTDEDAETYGDVKPISKAMNIKVDTESSNDTLNGDGALTASETTIGKTTIEAEVNDYPIEVQADLLGHAYDKTKGTLIENKEDKPPYVAVGFRLPKGNGGKNRYYWFYKGKFEEVSVEAQQKEDKVTFSTPTLKGTFVYNKDGDKRVVMDEDEGTTPPENFLKTVYKPTASEDELGA